MGPLLPRAGLNRVHRFVGLSVVGWRRCVPLSLKPVPFGAFPADLVLWALGEAERLGLRVDVLLLDPGLPQRGGSSSSRAWAHPSSSEPGKPRGSSACRGPRQEQAARNPLPDEGADTPRGGGQGSPSSPTTEGLGHPPLLGGRPPGRRRSTACAGA